MCKRYSLGRWADWGSEKIVGIVQVRNDIHLNKIGTVKIEMMVSKALCRQNEKNFIMD